MKTKTKTENKKKKCTDSFILSMPLKYERWQYDYLDKIFRVSVEMYNNLVADRKKALTQMEQDQEWQNIQKQLCELYKSIGKNEPTEEQKETLKNSFAIRNSILKKYGFSSALFQSRMKKWRKHHSGLVSSPVAQKIAMAVWEKFEDYLFSNGKTVNFKPWTRFLSIEGKSNSTGIRCKNNILIVNKIKIPVSPARNDYERKALSCRIKYCRIVRIPWKKGWLYRLQLVLEGKPPVKIKPETGEPVHPVGSGRVGIDIGTQTVAFVSGSFVRLEELSPLANMPYQKLRRINRAMDRSRRAMNPDFFNPNGTIIPKNKLSSDLLDKYGNRKWKQSKRYQRLTEYRRYVYAKQARIRVAQHNELANRILVHGNEIYVETMRFKALAKRAKPQNPENMKSGEKYKRRKRFGKSIANKAPALFLTILEKKVIAKNGKFYKIKTWCAKASQYNHINHEYKRKTITQRWNYMPDKKKVQRDLYSAFLIMNTNKTLDGFIQKRCDAMFERFIQLHDAEISRLETIDTPSSTGVKKRPKFSKKEYNQIRKKHKSIGQKNPMDRRKSYINF